MDPEINRHKFKDDIRRYHALMELLSTEVSYMQDLRILVSIYLRQIPTLTLKRSSSTSSTFGLNSSFSALSRANSSVHLSNITGHSSYIQPLTNAPSKEREKSPSRRIFKNPEIDVLTRNADEVLQFHEHFVEELRTAMAPLGIHMESSSEHSSDDEISVGNVETIDAGIAIVSTKFATEASRFTSYELFCAGHLEAIDVIRRVQNAHPTDWEAFEQKCSASAFEMLKSSDAVPVSISQLASTSQSRRNSTATIDDAVRYVRSRSNSLVKDKDTSTPRNRSRLTFMDYLIKPVQRICKYPLLLEQLKSSEPLYESKIRVPWLSGRNVVVESAAQAMRHVASTVDEARQRQDVAVRSALIASRILYSHVLQSPSPSPLQVLTPGFLSSLGPCHIAGSLDVIHQRSIKQSTGTANINVKYLGAFLYRDWATSKSSRQSNLKPGFHARFVSLAKGTSLNLPQLANRKGKRDGKGEIVPSMLDDPYEAIVPLPTINSVPELASDTGDQLTETLLDALATESQMLQATATSSPEVPSIPSRRSSSTSAQAFSTPTSPEYETFVIRQLFESPRSEFKAELSIINKF
ncbi:Dbl homology domain-containing protein [Lentinula edodes]|uniref:Dbl homology domain-containing protein n=1 Tax=Lentinula edodes TaxID=5353 RepID=A0A1Q3DVW8_LENED|nr:Dbl homology domain-containing protein [Lentinula edodes]